MLNMYVFNYIIKYVELNNKINIIYLKLWDIEKVVFRGKFIYKYKIYKQI